MVCHITKSDNWPHILPWHCQLGILLWSDSLPFHWTFQWGWNAYSYFQQQGAAAHIARVSVMLLCSVFRDRMISKGIWPPRLPSRTPPCFLYMGNERRSLHRQPSHPLELKEVIAHFIMSIPLVGLSCVFVNKIRSVDVCCNLSMYEKLSCNNVQGFSAYTYHLW